MTQIIVITSAIPPHFDFVVKLPRWPLDDETRDFSVENDENKSFQSIFFPVMSRRSRPMLMPLKQHRMA
jgi:hypothetical protein